MKRSSKPNKPPVLITIDDDSDCEAKQQQEVKRVKKAEEVDVKPATAPPPPPLSPNVLMEVQQKVAELEQKYQRACEAARESEARAEAAEKQIRVHQQGDAAQQQTVEELKQRLAESSQLTEDARREARNAYNREHELALEVDALTRELQEAKRSAGLNENSNHDLQGRVQQLESELWRASEERKKDKARIDELSAKLAQYVPAPPPAPEPVLLQQQPTLQSELQKEMEQLQQQEMQSAPAAVGPQLQLPQPKSHPAPINYTTPHPTNIFQMCDRDAQGTISFAAAKDRLCTRYNTPMKWFLRTSTVLTEILHCELCEKTLKRFHILAHFYSKDHAKKVRASGGSLSLAAFEYWQLKLVEARALMIIELAEDDAAAAAAPTTPATAAAGTADAAAAAPEAAAAAEEELPVAVAAVLEEMVKSREEAASVAAPSDSATATVTATVTASELPEVKKEEPEA